MTFLIRLVIVTSLLLMGGLAPAQQTGDLFVFANDGQDQDQQDMDTLQCQRIARDNTGFDPSQRPQASSAPPPDESSSTGRNVAGGAALGAAAGALISGNRNAVIGGAAAGGLLGGARSSRKNSQNEQRQQQWEQQQMAEYNRNRSNWNRAFAGCMESRGYTVS
ncbi:MAG: hypothetical protein ACR2QB_05595 [Gammaproteobacteria bacterium]